jgi:segregation and condensation protein A
MTLDTAENNAENDYKVKIDIFEGPLDLLLHLTKTAEIDIYDIPIAKITEQYLSYLSLLVYLDLDNLTDFIDMAATLVVIKSRAMLPVELDYEEDDNDMRSQLISTLLEYQKYKIAAGLLERKSEESVPLVARSNDAILFNINESVDENWKQLTVLDLIGAFAEILNKSDRKEPEIEVFINKFTVDDKIKDIRTFLDAKDSFNYFDLVRQNMPKLELVCTFLAVLELVKSGFIIVRQHLIFGDIHIFKKEKFLAKKIE